MHDYSDTVCKIMEQLTNRVYLTLLMTIISSKINAKRA